MSEWISFVDQFPKDRQVVLTYANGHQEVAVWRREEFTLTQHSGLEISGATHWKPLDAPPERL